MTIEYYYLCDNPDEEISENIIRNANLKQGNYDTLYNQIKSNPNFCKEKEQSGIDYNFFLENIGKDPTVYIIDTDIQDINKNIVGATFFCSGPFLMIFGICVPIKSDKKYGTLLINKLKQLAYGIGSRGIALSTIRYNIEFYKKNGFEIFTDDINLDNAISMIYYINTSGGKRCISKSRKKRRIKHCKRKTRK